MKFLYFVIAIAQSVIIAGSAILRRRSWGELDFPASDPHRPSLLDISGYLFLLWLASIAVAAILAMRDKPNRSRVFLLLVVLLPFLEFWGWFIYSF
ncbi:hypothetical protein CF68_23975 [Cupriavidus sp. SK-4]|nr:hypothetical protein CF68_23975 [Cupriavidus sp. SK-4]